MEERCELCRFWELSGYSLATGGERIYGVGGHHTDGSVSNCRRYAPTTPHPKHDGRLFGDTLWPTTRRDAWCGEFQPRAAGRSG